MSKAPASRRRAVGLGPAALARLAPRLDALATQAGLTERVGFDPVEFPRRFRDPRDVEVSGLLAAALSYGRADLFKPKIEIVLTGLGAHPAQAVRALDVRGAAELLHGFVYRFNVATDVAVLLLGMGQALERHGSLEALFLRHHAAHPGDLHAALAGFLAELRDLPMAPLRKALGKERGLQHMLPVPLGPGAAKRLLMYLRWMVRGPDAVDLGIWRNVPASALIIPLDTHTGRMALNLGLTRRTDQSWRTAVEVTAGLRKIDPQDPVRFDFALCHHGMSGACPATPRAESCQACGLLEVCRTGPGVLRKEARRLSGAAKAP
jgi:uncharacterized protein (TIGR02757 family)